MVRRFQLPNLVGMMNLVVGMMLSFGCGSGSRPTISDLATTEQNTPLQECVIRAFLKATYSKDFSVHSAPQSDTAILGMLPTDTAATILAIDRQQGQWIHFHSIELVEEDPVVREAFPQSGWIVADALAIDVQPERQIPPAPYVWPQLKQLPRSDSPLLEETSESVGGANLLGCTGTWVEVSVAGTSGWLKPGEYCGNPVTTCP